MHYFGLFIRLYVGDPDPLDISQTQGRSRCDGILQHGDVAGDDAGQSAVGGY